ncbi:adenosylcobinamide-GDP ribazoletransferase [Actinopolymorpha singaporensis]|uniref:Adenosylcobinamide-GDP ribazoletransferase n=1 Tax=Actinopolymorpha singaporensis TaxID=117157 RepID=A0A1H1S4X2_9ACTN|nr:adenosylcobinamide-GDP ribazoletransferase [Actinopolymorpha singaporensis]SDS42828.1 cobalamin-5'-phosphate synthase [Actinopolymorpha singaporensis]
MSGPTSAALGEKAAKGRGLALAVTMVTAVPVPGRWAAASVDRDTAGRAVCWLPFVGAVLGAVAGLPLLAATALVPDGTGALLGAALAVATLALATRGLHLDGLADTVDGLGSSAPAERALAIMRQPDIGPFGVVTVVLLLLVKVAALAALANHAPVAALLALAAAECVGRLGVVWATGAGVPSARPGGFGALVAGTTTRPTHLLLTSAVVAGCLAPLGWDEPRLTGALLGTLAAGLATAVAWRRHVVRRLGGVTGDVFGSVVELGAAAGLLAAVLLR